MSVSAKQRPNLWVTTVPPPRANNFEALCDLWEWVTICDIQGKTKKEVGYNGSACCSWGSGQRHQHGTSPTHNACSASGYRDVGALCVFLKCQWHVGNSGTMPVALTFLPMQIGLWFTKNWDRADAGTYSFWTLSKQIRSLLFGCLHNCFSLPKDVTINMYHYLVIKRAIKA